MTAPNTAGFLGQCEGCGRFSPDREFVQILVSITVNGRLYRETYLHGRLTLCPACRTTVAGTVTGRTEAQIRGQPP